MPKITIVFGLLLCGLSALVLYLNQEFKLGTWLIPAGFGVPLIVLGAIATKEGATRKHAMHAAVTLALLGGLIALSRGIVGLVSMANGKPPSSLAAGMVWTMTVICFVFVGLCVNSFISARKARQNQPDSQA